MKKGVFLWLVAALLAIRLGVMALTPVFDPSEARYAAMAATMARTGDFVVPHFTYKGVYQSFDGKPPLVFQAGGAFCKAFGVNEFAVRLFPLLCAVLLGFILHHTVKRFADADRARLAVLVYASSGAFYATAGFAMTDVPLAASVAGALLLYRCFLGGDRFSAVSSRPPYQLSYAAGVAALLGFGMLIKGPVSLVLFGLPVLVDAALNRHWKGIFNAKWLAVAPIYFLIAVPWFVLVEQRNPGSVYYFFVNENFKRFLVHEYGDRYGAGRETFRGMAAIWTFLALLPWVALAPFCRRWWKGAWKGMRKNFLLLGVFAITFFWCLTSRTLISYLLPVTPLFAAWLGEEGDLARLRRFAPWICGIVAVGLAIGLGVGSVVSVKMAGAKGPQLYGFHNSYAHEFYHGTSPECIGGKVDPAILRRKAIDNRKEFLKK